MLDQNSWVFQKSVFTRTLLSLLRPPFITLQKVTRQNWTLFFFCQQKCKRTKNCIIPTFENWGFQWQNLKKGWASFIFIPIIFCKVQQANFDGSWKRRATKASSSQPEHFCWWSEWQLLSDLLPGANPTGPGVELHCPQSDSCAVLWRKFLSSLECHICWQPLRVLVPNSQLCCGLCRWTV